MQNIEDLEYGKFVESEVNNKSTIRVSDDAVLTELQKKADLTEVQPVRDDVLELLLTLINKLGILNLVTDTTGSLRVATHPITIAANQDIRTVTTVTTVAGQTNIGGFVASTQVMANNNIAVNTGIRSNIHIS